jgi:hypothetical protein
MERRLERTMAVLAGASIGVGLMYLLDPQSGAQRRKMIRDRTASTIHSTGDAVGKAGRDLRNRTRGIAERAMSNFRRETPRPVDRRNEPLSLDNSTPRI